MLFICVDEGTDVIFVRRWCLVMGVFASIEISFFAVADSSLSVFVIFNARKLVEGVATV